MHVGGTYGRPGRAKDLLTDHVARGVFVLRLQETRRDRQSRYVAVCSRYSNGYSYSSGEKILRGVSLDLKESIARRATRTHGGISDRLLKLTLALTGTSTAATLLHTRRRSPVWPERRKHSEEHCTAQLHGYPQCSLRADGC